jgi:uncharacterized RDD family membrane protein YckC
MNTLPRVDTGLEGHYAGIVSRFAAFVIDVTTIAVLFALGGRVLEYVLGVLLRDPVSFGDADYLPKIALAVWALLYLSYPVAMSGRTFGMAVVGLRVVRADGSELGGRRALVRALVLPLSFLLLGFGFLLIVLRADRRALQDLIAGSAVVYAWDARAARVRFLARR